MREYFRAPWLGENEKDEKGYASVFHPKRQQAERPRKLFVKLPEKLEQIYDEVIQAYNADLPILCAGGLRTLMEGICADKGIQERTLEKKIDGLASILPQNIVSNLHGFRFIGNRALHEIEAPDRIDLEYALDVAEDLLNYLYELDYRASILARVASPSTGGASP